MQCAFCGYESEIEEMFRDRFRSFRRKPVTCCVECVAKRDAGEQRYGLALWCLGIGIAAALVTAFPEPWPELGWGILNYMVFHALSFPVVVAHELGHAVAGRLVGFKVFAVQIGIGRELLSRQVGDTRVSLHLIPFSGVTLSAPRHPGRFVPRNLLALGAGPAVNLAMTGVLLAVAGADAFFTFEPATSPFPLLYLLFWSNAIFGLWNLVPYCTKTAWGPANSDGRQIWLTLVDPGGTAEAHALAYAYLCAMSALQERDFDGAEHQIRAAIHLAPENRTLSLVHAGVLLERGETETGSALYRQLLASGMLRPIEAAVAKNDLAYAGAVLASAESVADADRLSLEALEIAGAVPHVLGTRGAVLVRLGRFEEGIGYCDRAIAKRIDPRSKAHNYCWIAIAAAQLGDSNKAPASLAAARKLGAGWPVVERLAAEAERLLETAPPA